MSNEERVADDPRLPRRVTLCALAPITTTAGSKKAGAISENGTAPWLVEGDPIFYLRTECLETHPGVVLVILHELVLVQHAPISLVQVVGEIPMKQRYHRFDACGTEVVDQLDVVLQTFFVYRVVASAEWYDAGPRERKAVRFCADILQESNVLVSAVVGIARNISGFSACNLARDAAEGVPNRISTAIFMRCAFDLVTAGSETQYVTTKRPPKRYIVAGYLGTLQSGERYWVRRTLLLQIPTGNLSASTTATCWFCSQAVCVLELTVQKKNRRLPAATGHLYFIYVDTVMAAENVPP